MLNTTAYQEEKICRVYLVCGIKQLKFLKTADFKYKRLDENFVNKSFRCGLNTIVKECERIIERYFNFSDTLKDLRF